MDWFLLAIISALLSATAAISQKKLLFTMDALVFSFLLSIFNMLFSVPFLFTVDYNTLSLTSLFILYIKTIIGAFAFYNVMLAIKNLDISRALPLMALTPGFVAVAAFFLLGDNITLYQSAGLVLLIAGTYLLELKSDRSILDPFKVFKNSKSHIYIITALLLFTITSLFDKLLVGNYRLSPAAFMGFQQIFLFLNFSILVLIKKAGISNSLKLLGNSKMTGAIVFIALITVAYRYTQIEAVKIAPVALVLSVKRTSIFFATVVGGRIFSEKNLLRRGIAALVLLIGAYIVITN